MAWLASVFAVVTAGHASLVAGTIRYDLPQLLGEYRFDRSTNNAVTVEVETPFHPAGVSRATVVIDGSVTAGTAIGDGVLREATEFVLAPALSRSYRFGQSQGAAFAAAQSDPLSINDVVDGPFESVTPLPGPGVVTPPFSFSVTASLGPALSTAFPSRLGSGFQHAIFLPNGYEVLTPIVANITEAYVILEGVGVVPEPSGVVLVVAGLLALRTSHRARRQSM